MGRPRKSAIKENVAPTEQKTSKSLIEDLEIQVEQLTTLLTGSIEAQLEYHQVATDAENKFKALVKITAHSLNMMLNHCEKVEQNTGSLTSEDVKYSVSLLKRTIEHNFKKD